MVKCSISLRLLTETHKTLRELESFIYILKIDSIFVNDRAIIYKNGIEINNLNKENEPKAK